MDDISDGDVEAGLLMEGPAEDVNMQAELQSIPTSTVTSLLTHRQSEVLKYIQNKGMHKLAEFEVEENLVYPAFKDGPMLTFGSDEMQLDAAWEWRQLLRKHIRPEPTGWHSTITVEAFVVPICGAANPDTKGLLHPLLRRYQAMRCSYFVFSLPAVQAIISYKWTTYARRRLMIQLALYVCWLVCFYGFIIAFQDEDLTHSLRKLLKTPRGQITVALEIGVLVCMLPFLVIDLTMAGVYRQLWIDPWRILSTITYINQVAISAMHLGRLSVRSEWLTIVLAVQCILLLFRLQYWSRAFRATRFAFADVLWEVVCDTSWLLVFLFIVMGGYAAAFHITFRTAAKEPEDYKSIWRSFLTMYEHVYGDLELKDFYTSKSMPIFATALAVSYIFVQGFILVNLLIGAIINSLDRVMEHAGAKQLVVQAQLIDEVEATASALNIATSFLRLNRPEGHPDYVHVLRIHPDKLDPVEEDQLHRRLGKRSAKRLRSRYRGAAREGSDSDDSSSDGGGTAPPGKPAAAAAREVDVALLLRQQAEILELLRAKHGIQLSNGRSD